MATTAYFKRSLSAQFSKDRSLCPNCGSAASTVVDRKFVVTQLRRCAKCELLFRTPTDDPAMNATFYESEYTQGFTTDLPTDAALAELKQAGFPGEKDFSHYISVLTQLGIKPGMKLFDFGCSWGYGSYQFTQAGFDVTSFEVGTTRRRYAQEKLGVNTVDDMDRVAEEKAGEFDFFFSSHVLEHVPVPATTFAYAMKLLKPGGVFVCFTPNGSAAHRAASPTWSKLWGEVHPNFIDDVFMNKSFQGSPRVVGASPITNASVGERVGVEELGVLNSAELFFAARKIGDAWA